MKHFTLLSSVSVVVLASLMGSPSAWCAVGDPIDPSGFTATADSWYPYGDPGVRIPIHAFQSFGAQNAGADTIEGTADDTHQGLSGSFPNAGWMTQSEPTATDTTNPWVSGQRWLMVDMGADFAIGQILLWNYYEGGGARGVKSTDIWYQTSTGTGALPTGFAGDGNGGDFVNTNWTNLGTYTLADATSDPTPITDTINPADFVARYVLFDIHTNYAANNNTNETGMGQVRFLEGELDNNAVPEPGTFVLAALGLIGLGLFALRNKSRKT